MSDTVPCQVCDGNGLCQMCEAHGGPCYCDGGACRICKGDGKVSMEPAKCWGCTREVPGLLRVLHEDYAAALCSRCLNKMAAVIHPALTQDKERPT